MGGHSLAEAGGRAKTGATAEAVSECRTSAYDPGLWQLSRYGQYAGTIALSSVSKRRHDVALPASHSSCQAEHSAQSGLFAHELMEHPSPSPMALGAEAAASDVQAFVDKGWQGLAVDRFLGHCNPA